MRLQLLAFAVPLCVLSSIAAPASAQGPYPGGYRVRASEPVAEAAHQLSNDTLQLANVLRAETGYSHLSDDALELARSAARFHRSVERDTRPERLRRSFDELQTEYLHMREMLFQAHQTHHSADVAEAWSAVAGQFEKLALVSGGNPQLCEASGYSSRGRYDHRGYQVQ